MICDKCRNNYTIIKPEYILLNNNISCGYCNDFSKAVDIICLHSKVEYQSDLTNWLYLNSPVMDGDKLIIANSRDFNIPFCDGSMLISEILSLILINIRECRTCGYIPVQFQFIF